MVRKTDVKHISVIMLDWSEIMSRYKTADAVARDRRMT